MQRKKEAKEKAQMEKERTVKEQAEQEHCDSKKSGKSPLPETEQEE